MRNKILLIILLIIIAVALIGISKKETPIKSPIFKQETIQNYNPPKEIKYDSSTDLTKELESVNPQVLDNDFMVE